MTKKIVTAACALALGIAWTMAPAIAADDTAKDKMERTKDKTENKMERAKDKTKEGMEKTKDKASEVTEKTKDKSAEIKDTIKNKVSGRDGSDDVRRAQEALTAKGHNPGPVDGKMGPQTRAALKEFQTKENMKVTGRLDSDTKAKLNGGTTTSRASDTAAPSASPTTTTQSKN
jgi:peptidoglycan hydrolase-like protein with peptidoglycan-binding domain